MSLNATQLIPYGVTVRIRIDLSESFLHALSVNKERNKTLNALSVVSGMKLFMQAEVDEVKCYSYTYRI